MMLSPLRAFDAGVLDLQPYQRRRHDVLRGRLVYLARVEAIVAVQTRLSGGWRCEVVARRRLHHPGPRVDVSDDEIAAAVSRLPIEGRAGLVVWQARMLWLAWTYQRWRAPRMRKLCRILAEDLRTPGTLTVDLHAGAVRRILHQLNMRPPGLGQLLRRLTAAGVLTPLTPAREGSWGRFAMLLPVAPRQPRRQPPPRSGPDTAGTGWVSGTVALALLILVTGCAPRQQAPAASPPAPVASATSTTPSSRAPGVGAATALDAYRGMWKAYVDASRVPDPQLSDLTRYAQGDALTAFVNGLTSMQRDGLISRGDVVLHPKITTIRPNASPPTADIEDCADTSKTQLVKKDGSAYQDNPGGRQSARATVTQVSEGVWMVTSFALFGVGTC